MDLKGWRVDLLGSSAGVESLDLRRNCPPCLLSTPMASSRSVQHVVVMAFGSRCYQVGRHQTIDMSPAACVTTGTCQHSNEAEEQMGYRTKQLQKPRSRRIAEPKLRASPSCEPNADSQAQGSQSGEVGSQS